ncbi:hypothetical protein BGZ58_002034 [Dissophora ornata]|nr:hypothetical protein BGZ58_002034 [Dissophora ornata]
MDLLLFITPQCVIESFPLVLGTIIYEIEIIRFLFLDYSIPPTSPHKSLDSVAAFIPWEVPKKARTYLGTLVAWVCGVIWFLSEFALDLVLVALGKSIEDGSTTSDRHNEEEDWMKGKDEWSKKQWRQKLDGQKFELLDEKEAEEEQLREEQQLLEILEELVHLQLSATLEPMSVHAKEISLANATKPRQEECEEREERVCDLEFETGQNIAMDDERRSDAEIKLTFEAREEEYRKEAVSHSRDAIDVLDAETTADSIVEDYIQAVEQDEPSVVHAETPKTSVDIMSLDNVSLPEPHIEPAQVLYQGNASMTISEESVSPDIDTDAITEVPRDTINQEGVLDTNDESSDIIESVADAASEQGEAPTAVTSLASDQALMFAEEFKDTFGPPLGAQASQASPTVATFGERSVHNSSPARSPTLGWINFQSHPHDLIINTASPVRRNSTPLGTSPILKASKATEITFSSGHSSDTDNTTSEQTTNTVPGSGKKKKNKKKKKASASTAGSVPSSPVDLETVETALEEENVKEHQGTVIAPENHDARVETTSASKPVGNSKPSKSRKSKKK